MEKQFLPNENPAERLKILRDNSVKSEMYNYPKELSKEDLDELKDRLAQDKIKLFKFDEKKKDFMEQYKADTKPLKSSVEETVTRLRTKVEEVEEEVYLIADHDDNTMLYYNGDGKLVHFRPLAPNERQYSILDNTKNGTYNQ